MKQTKNKAISQKQRLREKDKTLSKAELQRNLKKEAPPKSTQKTIQYKRMFEDGICEIEPGFYSKSIQISDINYQIARREDQVAVFTKYCEVLNYIDSDLFVQISLINRRIEEEEIRENMFYAMQNDGLDKYREEKNRMMSEKAVQGNNSMLRDKYVTFATHASSYTAAIQYLSRHETDLTTLFKAMGCEVTPLDGERRLNVLHNQLLPKEQFTFKYDDLVGSSLTTKDIIAPASFTFTDKSSYEFGNNYGQTVFLKDLPPDLADDLISALSEISADMTISIHINGVEQDKAFDLVNRKISFMEQNKIDEQKKAQKSGYDPDMIPHELKYSLQEALELKDDLQNKNQRMFKVTLLIHTSADDLDALDDNVFQILATARKKNCKAATLDYLQEEAMNSTLPLGKNYIPIERTLTTASTAIFIPFTTQELFQPGGMCYGINARSKNLVFLDRKSLKTPSGIILGTPGSGKGMAAKDEIISNLLNDPNSEVIVLDPEREYAPLAAGFDGEIIKIANGSKDHINPMDISLDYGDDDNPIQLKNDFILSLCDLLIGGKQGLSNKHKSLIDRACRNIYQGYFDKKTKTPMPTLETFWEEIKMQPEPEAQSLAMDLELYIKGSLSAFAKPTNVNTEKRFVIYDTLDLGKQLRGMGMLIVLDQIWNRITQNRAKGIRTWLYIDELQLFFTNENAAQYFFELWSRARKWGAIPTGITQNVETLLQNDLARKMLSNSDFILMLNQAMSDRTELAHLLNISNQQLSYVTNSDAGHGLLFAGNSIVPIINKIPNNTELYRMMTTKIEDITKYKQEQENE